MATNTKSKVRGRRPDGRLQQAASGSTSTSLRALSCELSTTQRADGSALWKSGSTHVLAAVYGPIAPRVMMISSSSEIGDEAVLSVVIKSGHHHNNNNNAGRPAAAAAATMAPATTTSIDFSNNNHHSKSFTSNSHGMLEREWEQILTGILTACVDTKAYARAVVEVVVQVIQDDGSVFGAALHASVAALMDAGVCMTKLPVATSFLVLLPDDGGNNKIKEQQPLILLDPTSGEEMDPNAAVLVIVTENEHPDCVLAMHTAKSNACLNIPTMLSCAKAASKVTQAVVYFWRLAMKQRVAREAQTLWSS